MGNINVLRFILEVYEIYICMLKLFSVDYLIYVYININLYDIFCFIFELGIIILFWNIVLEKECWG